MANDAKLSLPLSADSAEAFRTRLSGALSDASTQVYIDTSFLMWMVSIGSKPRLELIEWLVALCGDRLTVPVWAAHEFYRHYASGTLSRQATAQIDALEKAVSAIYTLSWPLLDESSVPVNGKRGRQSEIGEILRAVPRAVEIARQSLSSYDRNAKELIPFINSHAIGGSQLPAYFETLEAVSDARFTGRVPPGFMDRDKSTRQEGEGENAVEIGDNRWGDLVFWREVLSDAKRRRARSVVLLTRDAKPDWRAGGSLTVVPAEDGGAGVPPPHPFLSFEAALEANVREVILADQRRLASVAKVLAPDRTAAFIYTAVAPSLPQPITENERRADLEKQRAVTEQAVRSSIATAENVSFLDPPNIKNGAAVFKSGHYNSRADQDPSANILAWEERLTDEAPISRILDEAACKGLTGPEIIVLARRLSQRAVETGVNAAALVDLTDELRRYPPKVAGLIYYGLLAEAFYKREDNDLRAAPRSPVLQRLYRLQGEPWALIPIKALLDKTSRADQLPLYLPNPLAPRLKLSCLSHFDREPAGQLRGVQVNGVELLSVEQADPSLRLATMLGGEAPTLGLLTRLAADLYGLPIDQIDAEADVTGQFVCEPYLGFRSPAITWLSREELSR